MCRFAHILNEGNLTFPWHVKNLFVYTSKNKRNKERKKIEDAKFLKQTFPNNRRQVETKGMMTKIHDDQNS